MKIKLYDLLTPSELEAVRDKTEVRNVKFDEITVRELIDLFAHVDFKYIKDCHLSVCCFQELFNRVIEKDEFKQVFP